MKSTQDKILTREHPSSEKDEADATTTKNVDELIKGLIDTKCSMRLSPKTPDKCPVFCCFYAEFDVKTGPVVRYQSPKNFMDRDINTNTTEIHAILEETFERYKNEQKVHCDSGDNERSEEEQKGDNFDRPFAIRGSEEVVSSLQRSTEQTSNILQKEQKLQFTPISIQEQDDQSRSKAPKDEASEKEVAKSDESSDSAKVNLPEGGQSFFDSTSEYIITGSELTGKIITLSTHDVHVMTRPTQITNERYERNALLFSIGMVLRRAADPRPFRPLISKLAMTLRSMEIESGILSDPTKVDLILQPLLEQILISMNSPRWECNLLLDRSTALNLKLFHPPKPPATPVHNYHVPVLLVRDFQLGFYEWDLAINWVILHIDGVTNAWQISVKAEVDLEMVLACLRVLRHHGVISVVDMFLYTNRYECTERAAAMLAGKEDKLLQEAVDFATKRHQAVHLVPPPVPSPRTVPSVGSGNTTGNTTGSPKSGSPKSGSPYYSTSSCRPHGITPSSSYPPRSLNLLGGGGGSQRSSNFRHAMLAASSLEREQASFLEGAQRHLDDRKQLKVALSELYCACNRNLSFGDLWLSLTVELPTSLDVPTLNKSAHRGTGSFTNYIRPRKDSLTEYDMSENEAVAFSPMESCYLESLRYRPAMVDEKNKTNQSNGKISVSSLSTSLPTNWNGIFKEFDHRRFITFGVINGLLTRVHSYPFFAGSFAERRRNSLRDSTFSLVIPPESTRLQMKIESIEEKNFQLAKSVAAMMDGTRFDDELVCTFEKPFNRLVELVEKYSGKKVSQIYARGG